MGVTRRGFLAASGVAGLAFAGPAVRGAEKDKRYRTVLIGSGWWGMNILRTAIQAGRSDVVALCDVDGRFLQKAAEEVEGMTGKEPKQYKDFRELLDEQKPEIAIVATPDHWHPLITIAACQAGAHVYVEKPVGHTLNEGRAMVQAARAAGRVVQVGTHRRVSPHNIWGIRFLREGKLGKVGMIRAFVHSAGGPGQPTPDEDPPKELDWDMWCGPAPLRPFNRAIHPRGFRQFLDYANGTLGDWGIHWMDHILWWSEEQYPKMVSSCGGRYIRQDNADAPDTQVVQFQFDSFTACWEHRRYAGNNAEKHPLGIYFYGTEGTLHIGWRGDGTTFYPRHKGKEPVNVPPQLHMPDYQNIPELWANFLDSIETGRRPVCDIEIGHRSTSLSLLGMLSLKLGRSIAWDGEKEECPHDPEANRLLRRPYRPPWQYPEV
ncbi:MAG TPA: Gfo/Idh/MocA family oxidoreductase [Planctomycetes bacterium]|nr:Gfo/Idh/MocA family oxidoreductase [Planctomycetota bacterium]